MSPRLRVSKLLAYAQVAQNTNSAGSLHPHYDVSPQSHCSSQCKPARPARLPSRFTSSQQMQAQTWLRTPRGMVDLKQPSNSDECMSACGQANDVLHGWILFPTKPTEIFNIVTTKQVAGRWPLNVWVLPLVAANHPKNIHLHQIFLGCYVRGTGTLPRLRPSSSVT